MEEEVIRKTIKLEYTGVTSGNEFIFIPYTGATYNIKFSLSKREIDLGYFDGVNQSLYGYYSYYGYGNNLLDAIGMENML
jgi:hypothetical protein